MRFIIYAAIVIGGAYLFRFLLNKSKFKAKSEFLQWVAFCVLIGLCVLTDWLGTAKYGNQIGHFFENSDYQSTGYYVNVWRNEDDAKNYRVPAEIEREGGEYHIYRFVFPNGGEITFDDTNYNNPLKLNKKVEIEDDSGETWFIELTNNKLEADNPYKFERIYE